MLNLQLYREITYARGLLKLLGKGKKNQEIAQALHLTEGTVKNHITRILGQLKVRDRTQAALWAQKYLDQHT